MNTPYTQQRAQLLGSIGRGPLVVDYWGTPWRVERSEPTFANTIRWSFFCEYVSGNKPASVQKGHTKSWVPFANVQARAE